MSSDGARSHEGPVVVFDGICVLCNGWVRFLLKHDRQGRCRFAAMQTDAGRELLVSHGLDPDDPVSFLLVEGGRAWTDTDAIRRVLTGLGGAWRLAALSSLVPRFVRDPLYRLLARNRYRVFGTTACHVPTKAERSRFVG
ncbi:thiol-disulfide oxidoreductase DCC family protein [Pseudoxanthomonas putridarboris]|uniref:Thiol-disulfide oxidoreductase DCC family protein n=1 Tax=Pseudoxanthomonas putridarboris TaxID=752605 RepID=A0ABU9J3Z6_9GAMM